MIFLNHNINYTSDVKLTLTYATFIQTGMGGREMRTSFRYNPKVSLAYTMNTTGLDNVVNRRYDAEKELYNECVVPLRMINYEAEIMTAKSLRLTSNTSINFLKEDSYIFYGNNFYKLESALHLNANEDKLVGLQDALPISSGNITFNPALIMLRDNSFYFSFYKLDSMEEEIVWNEQ